VAVLGRSDGKVGGNTLPVGGNRCRWFRPDGKAQRVVSELARPLQ
jgi:hypothetical protein